MNSSVQPEIKAAQRSSLFSLNNIYGHKKSNFGNTKDLLKYFPKHYQNLNVKITSGPVVTKLKRVKAIKSFYIHLGNNYSKDLGLALAKSQAKFLKRLPHIESKESPKEIQFTPVIPEDIKRYFPLFLQLDDLSVQPRKLAVGFFKQEVAPIKTNSISNYLFLVKKTLKRFSMTAWTSADIYKFTNQVWRYRDIFGRLEDFEMKITLANISDLLLNKWSLSKDVTYLKLLDYHRYFDLEKFNLLSQEFENLKGLSVSLKLNERLQEKMSFDGFKRLTKLILSINCDLSLLVESFLPPTSLQALNLRLSSDRPLKTSADLELLNNFNRHWEKLDQLRSFNLKIIGNAPFFSSVQNIFEPVLERIPNLVSLGFFFGFFSIFSQAPPLSQLLKLSSFLPQKATENLKSLTLDFYETQVPQDTDIEALKGLKSLSLLKIVTSDMSDMFVLQALEDFSRDSLKNSRTKMKFETIQIASFTIFWMFLDGLGSLKTDGNKISIKVKVISETEEQSKLIFEEYCKYMSSDKKPLGVNIKLILPLMAEDLMGIVSAYPLCKRFTVLLANFSEKCAFENGALVDPRYRMS